MNAAVAAFKAQVDPILTGIGTDLDNIAADEAGLAAKIAALQAIIDAGNSTLDPEATAALADILTTAQSMATKTKAIADAVPDAVTPAP